MSDFFLGFSIALFCWIIVSKFFLKQSQENKTKILLVVAVTAFVISIILGWDDILNGFRDGFNASSTQYKDLNA